MKAGLFFGTFDPVHIAHLAIANYIKEFTDIDEVWFVISPQSPYKTNSKLTYEGQRKEMLQMALANTEGYKICDIEFTLPRPSYTYKTLQALSSKYPETEFSLILGGDNLESLPKWKNSTYILENYEVLVYPRPNFETQDLLMIINTFSGIPKNMIKIVNAPLIQISSTFIRNSIKHGKDIRFFLPPDVYDYIKENNLYTGV